MQLQVVVVQFLFIFISVECLRSFVCGGLEETQHLILTDFMCTDCTHCWRQRAATEYSKPISRMSLQFQRHRLSFIPIHIYNIFATCFYNNGTVVLLNLLEDPTLQKAQNNIFESNQLFNWRINFDLRT